MEKAVELLHRTKEAPTDEKAAHFEQFLRLIRCAPYFHPNPAPASPPLTRPLLAPTDPCHPLSASNVCIAHRAGIAEQRSVLESNYFADTAKLLNLSSETSGRVGTLFFSACTVA
jgi:hypothetical protein